MKTSVNINFFLLEVMLSEVRLRETSDNINFFFGPEGGSLKRGILYSALPLLTQVLSGQKSGLLTDGADKR